ncbi:hypothetical protein B0H17DRAFT_1328265 [Mycena rosella]|uniref:Transmembrane protein n=1 Tax=Mycena rosella TaxID=1033263 RepID=A0AAD7DUG1_MYCRO|nr:hypothetical protein B0H17DRAFT_1328265 [Mycena rosella]
MSGLRDVLNIQDEPEKHTVALLTSRVYFIFHRPSGPRVFLVPTMPPSALSSSVIDDRDPTVSYTGTWVVGGTSHEHDGTVSSSLNVGDSFSVPFTGTTIAVYGTFDASSAGVKTSYAIDGGSPITVTSSSSGADSFQQLFWQSDAVTSGSHKLVVTMLSVNNVGDGEGTIWFDYFNVTSAADVSTPSSSSGTSSTTGSASGTGSGTASITRTSAGSSSSSTSSTVAVATKSHSHSGVIAAVVVVVILLALAVGFVLIRRRRRQQKYSGSANMSAAPMGGPPPTQPFLAPSTPISGFPGSPQMQGAPYAPAPYTPGPGGFDAHASYAAPASAGPYGNPGQSAQAPYDPFASPRSTMYAATPSYAASASSGPSSSQSRPALSVVGSTAPDSEYGDSIADLKRRQQQVVNSYEQGISGAHAPPIQHVDSGVRALALDGPGPSELPPIYTPH